MSDFLYSLVQSVLVGVCLRLVFPVQFANFGSLVAMIFILNAFLYPLTRIYRWLEVISNNFNPDDWCNLKNALKHWNDQQ